MINLKPCDLCKKIWVVIGVLLLIGLAVFAYLSNREKNEFKFITNDEELAEFLKNMKEGDAERYIAWKKEQYANDPYGGDTPEETWQMFVSALEKGDIELASKYFVVEKQEEMKEGIDNIAKNGYLTEMVDDLLNNYKKEGFSVDRSDYRYVKRNEEGIVVGEIILIINSQTNKWKILEL